MDNIELTSAEDIKKIYKCIEQGSYPQVRISSVTMTQEFKINPETLEFESITFIYATDVTKHSIEGYFFDEDRQKLWKGVFERSDWYIEKIMEKRLSFDEVKVLGIK